MRATPGIGSPFNSLLGLAVAIPLLDITLTEWALHHLNFAEGNPLIDRLHRENFALLMLFRLAAVTAIAGLVFAARLTGPQLDQLRRYRFRQLFMVRRMPIELARSIRIKATLLLLVSILLLARALVVLSNSAEIAGIPAYGLYASALAFLSARLVYYSYITVLVAIAFLLVWLLYDRFVHGAPGAA